MKSFTLRPIILCILCSISVGLLAQPNISAVTPQSGQVGTSVIITGTGFNPTPTNNLVIFGATAATVMAATASQLTVTVPTGATYAPIMVLNTATGLLGFSQSNFTPTFSPNKGTITASDFNPKVDFATGSTPLSIAIGDLDGDGKADIAVANGGNSISVLLNTSSAGSVSYAARVDFGTGMTNAPRYIAIGDLDGDGKADLAVATNGINNVLVFRNTSSVGSVSFAEKVDFATGTTPFSLSIGDLDGDGRADLAVANYESHTISVFRNTGSAGSVSFEAKVDFATSTNPSSVSIGDLDDDGKVDLAVTNGSSNSVSVFRNTSITGSISFEAKVDFATGSVPTSVSIGDLDGDGKADLAVSNVVSNTVSVLRNMGNLNYAAKVDFAVGSSPYSVSIGDLDGDGKAELAVANANSNTASVLRNMSSAGSVSYAAKVDFATGSQPFSLSIGDLNGDGKADLAVANLHSNTVSVIRNNPILSPIIASFAPNSGVVGTTVTITGNGFSTAPANNVVIFGATRATVIAATATQLIVKVPIGASYAPITVLDTVTGLLAYSHSNFTPTFSPSKGSITEADFSPRVDFSSGSNPFSVSIGDLDGDGKADLAVANSSNNTVSVFRNTGSAGNVSFAAKVDFATGVTPRSVSIGDLDGDGKADLAVANESSMSVSVLRNTGSAGNVSYAAKVDFVTGTQPFSVSIGDLDGDGKADLAVTNFISSTVSVLRNTGIAGSVSFAAKVDFATGSGPLSVALGDLDGDGKTDLAVANSSSNTVSVFRNTGSAGNVSYAAKVDFATGRVPYSVSMGDLDGDDKTDLAVANADNSNVSIFHNTSSVGSVSFTTKVDFETGSGPSSVSIGDLDGDGKADLAVTNFSSNTVSLLRNTSSPDNVDFTGKLDFATGDNPISVSIGDLDGDGKADFALANANASSATATISIFRNNPVFPTPVISLFSPTSAPVGSAVTITGFNFDPTPANNEVKFNGVTATVTASTFLSITTSVPVGAPIGQGPITVTVGGATGTSAGNFTVNKLTQTLSFTSIAPSNATVGGATYTPTATVTSGLPVAFSLSPSSAGVATLSNGVISFVGVGTVTVNADQAGDPNYNAATQISQSFNVGQGSQTITFNTLAAKTFGDGSFTLSATASSGLTVSYASSNTAVATVSGNTVTIVGVGSTTITASQAGNTNYTAAVSVPQFLTVNKANQTITFAALTDRTVGDAAFTISATASSGVDVTFESLTTGKVTVAGNTVTIVAPGTATIRALQEGNASFNAAPAVERTFCVKPAKPSISVSNSNTEAVTLTSSSSSGNKWFLNGTPIAGAINSTLDASQPGLYTVQVTIEGCNSELSDAQVIVITQDTSNPATDYGIYPNPATDKLMVDLTSFAPPPVDVKIIDGLGRLMYSNLTTGGDYLEVDVDAFTPALYYIIVTQQGKSVQQKFVKK